MTDSESLIQCSIRAMSGSRDDEAVSLLGILLEREPENTQGMYLLAAQYAHLGMLDQAENGFRRAIMLEKGDFPMPRFQLGQLLMVQGRLNEAVEVLALLASTSDAALRAYATALIALAGQQIAGAIESLREGLMYDQAIPVLADDMRRLLAELEREPPVSGDSPAVPGHAASMLLSNYEKH